MFWPRSKNGPWPIPPLFLIGTEFPPLLSLTPGPHMSSRPKKPGWTRCVTGDLRKNLSRIRFDLLPLGHKIAPIRTPPFRACLPPKTLDVAPPGCSQSRSRSRRQRRSLTTIPVSSHCPSFSNQCRSSPLVPVHLTDKFWSSFACGFEQNDHDRRNPPAGGTPVNDSGRRRPHHPPQPRHQTHLKALNLLVRTPPPRSLYISGAHRRSVPCRRTG
jgi:hypothetical protein